MNRDELQRLRPVIDELSRWSARARDILAHRSAVEVDARAAASQFVRRAVQADLSAAGTFYVLALRPDDEHSVGLIARQASLPKLSDWDASALQSLTTHVAEHLRSARWLFGLRRLFTGAENKHNGEASARYLVEVHTWASQSGVPDLLSRADDRARRPGAVALSRCLDDETGLGQVLATFGESHLLSPTAFASLPGAVGAINAALGREDAVRQNAVRAGAELRKSETAAVITEMPVERLKEATNGQIRVRPLTDAGFRTVNDVLNHAHALTSIQGIGATIAQRIHGAARTLWAATYDEMPVRIDIAKPTPETFELVRSLHAWDTTRVLRNAATDLNRTKALEPLAAVMSAGATQLVVTTSRPSPAPLVEAVDAVISRARSVARSSFQGSAADSWQDFLTRPADYFGMLHELGFIVEDEDAVAGGLPEEIVEAVRGFPLETRDLTVASLRGYQGFAARFALVQRKVIIGDEMGLGKTVEALAAIAHLHAKGSRHALVVCPAAVVTNWTREVQSKSVIRAHRLHGQGRDAALRSWRLTGGVAVTTYESLGWLEPHLPSMPEIACAVFDEAHYIKNPSSLRARRSAGIIESADRAILLTGTPLENRVAEFRNLVNYVRPDLVLDATDYRPRLFRQQVAPAYLRRNQEDVLTELPELVEVQEWLPMSREDLNAYSDAVFTRNFQAMRQAAMLSGTDSTKLSRLIEIVEEAEDNGRKVIVFSNYLDVLSVVTDAMPGRVFGPISGKVPAARRQEIVDEFSGAESGAVLIAQIVAGGVGLNIQAASIVVICEPQLKPTTEWQAIARARRMGQLQSVQVHRLLSEVGVDQRVTEILTAKTAIFSEFAAISDMADTAPEAVDVSEAELVKEVLESERRRLFPGLQPEDELTA